MALNSHASVCRMVAYELATARSRQVSKALDSVCTALRVKCSAQPFLPPEISIFKVVITYVLVYRLTPATSATGDAL